MVYPTCKVLHGRLANDVGQDNGVASERNREQTPCTAVAEDGEAQWQDVSAGVR